MTTPVDLTVDPRHGLSDPPFFDFAVVVGPEKVTDPGHPDYGDGNTYTGLYAISCLSRDREYIHVPALWPSLSCGAQTGTIYPPDTLVLIAHVTQRKIPVILGAVDSNYMYLRREGKINIKHVNPEERSVELQPGEQMIQAAVKDVRESAASALLEYMGGYFKANKDGGVDVVTRFDGDLRFVHGDPDKPDTKLTTIIMSGERDADAVVELKHSSGTTVTIAPDGSVTIENVKAKTEHTTEDHVQNDDSNLLLTVKGNTILKCDNVQMGDDEGERVLQGETFQGTHNFHTHMGNLGFPTGPPSFPSTEADLSDKVHTKK